MSRLACTRSTRSTMRRGSLYVAVLSVALLVSIIGVSAMLAARVEQRALVDTESAAKADCGVASIADLALFWITADSNWRATYAAGTWTYPLVVDGVTLQYKLIDELDGNLTNDPTQPARLYVKAIFGNAVRLESVLCQPQSGWNLLNNGGFESGTTGWYTKNAALELRTDGPHSGVNYLRIKTRAATTDGAGQTLTSGIKSGTSYQIDVWAKMKSGSDSLVVALATNSTRGGYTVTSGTPVAIGTTWQKVTATITPSWYGVLVSADLYISTTTYKNDFDLDDVVLMQSGTQPTLVPIPGTWRQEIRTGTSPLVPSGSPVPMPS